MDDTRVTLKLGDIEILEEDDGFDQDELGALVDALTHELQQVPRVRRGRRFVPVWRSREETTVTGGRHRTWTPGPRDLGS